METPEANQDFLSQLLGNLTDADLEKLSTVASQFTGGTEKEESAQNNEDFSFPFDPEMIFRLMSIFEKLNSSHNDPRCNLILALKPLLSPPRQQKADHALEILRLMSIFSSGDIFGME